MDMRWGSVVLIALAGCGRSGPATVPVSGRITLDKEPVAKAAVMFVPDAGGRPAAAVTDAQGHYALSTFKPEDGAVVGKHSVAITLQQAGGVQADANGLSGVATQRGPKPQWLVPEKYSRPATSGLTATVPAAGAQINFDLSKSP